jgi:uncharacterized membrane protein YhaH (DUF805 family)
MSFLEKLQKLPKAKKYLILWSLATLIGIFLFLFWLSLTTKKLEELKRKGLINEINIPPLNLQENGK